MFSDNPQYQSSQALRADLPSTTTPPIAHSAAASPPTLLPTGGEGHGSAPQFSQSQIGTVSQESFPWSQINVLQPSIAETERTWSQPIPYPQTSTQNPSGESENVDDFPWSQLNQGPAWPTPAEAQKYLHPPMPPENPNDEGEGEVPRGELHTPKEDWDREEEVQNMSDRLRRQTWNSSPVNLPRGPIRVRPVPQSSSSPPAARCRSRGGA